jgi:pimeloyl-ACP methyl ester carboxylesterase
VASPLQRPDGVEIHWEEQGRGPLVVIVHQIVWSFPQVYAELIADLARDHRVVTFDARGCGASTRRGPYDTETDAGDLLAVAEAAGGAAILPRSELRQADVMGSSDSVIELLTKLMRTDQRAAVRTLLAAVNPRPGRGRAARAGGARRQLRLAGVRGRANRGVAG